MNIDLAQDKIGSMRRTNFQEKQIRRKEHNSGQSDSAFLCHRVILIKLRTLEQLQVIHIRPGMITLVNPNISTALFNQFRTKICHLNPGV